MAFNEGATRRLLFLCTALLLVVCHAFADSPQCKSGSSRLSKRIKPIHYEVKLNLDWEKLQFKGRVAIDIEFDEAGAMYDLVCKYTETPSPSCDTKKIILHAGQELEIETVELVAAKKSHSRISAPEASPPTKVNFCRDSSNNQLILELDDAFTSAGQLVLTYTGQLKKEVSKGFFLSEEHDSEGEYTPLWVTSLEPGWARTVFPCFDEPDLKATFKVSVEHPQGLTALSNMGERMRSEYMGRTEVTFERTPKMSTYLFAVAIGKMDSIVANPPNSKITFRAWAPPGRAGEARESLNLIVKSYDNFVKYFDVEQPLKKIDFISVKRALGGTESWGLVALQPFVLLDGLERKRMSIFTESTHDVKSTLVNKMAHFWFGNLVTMKWWDDLWLKEGFAIYMANTEINKIYPELGGKHFDLIYGQSETLRTMIKPEFAHPIKQSALQSMDDIVKSFDFITYDKAAAVLKMVSNYIGAGSFQTGVQKYIKKFMYKNAEADDLWKSLSGASGRIDVGVVMNSWIQNEGFPLIEAYYAISKFFWMNRWALKLKQRKFAKGETVTAELWQIPISILVSDGGDKTETIQTLLTTREAEILLPSWFDPQQPGHFVKVNKDNEGLYRVLYNEYMMQALKKATENKILSPADRMNLLDDYLAFSLADLVEIDKLHEVTSWFKSDDHEAILLTVLSVMDTFAGPIAKYRVPERIAILLDYFHKKVESTLNVPEEDLFKSKENLLQTIVRVRVLFTLVRFQYQPAIDFSLEYFRSRQGKVAHHMMKPIYSAIALAGTDEEYEQMKKSVDELINDPRTGLIRAINRVIKYETKRSDFRKQFAS